MRVQTPQAGGNVTRSGSAVAPGRTTQRRTMSVAELPPRAAEQPRTQRAIRRIAPFHLTLEQAAYFALFALALTAHLWGLDVRAYHHDETHHAYFSWRLYQGLGYVHDPLLHGPFLYFANAFVYFLFGDDNFTARLSVALFGSSLVLMPYLIRRELGRGAALVAALYLAVSPVFLYVGRFIRHDPFAVAFELIAFIGIVRYVSTRKAAWLYAVAAALGLMCVTMESFFLYVAIMLPLVIGLFLWRIWKPGLLIAAATGLAVVALVFVLPGEPERSGGNVVRLAGNYNCPTPSNPLPPDNPMKFTPGPLFGLPPLATADNNYGLCVRNQPDNSFVAYFSKLGQFFGHPAILLAILALLTGVAATAVLIWRVKGRDSLTPWQRARSLGDPAVEAFASLTVGRRVWIAFGIFFAIYALFFSAFLTNPVGILSGLFGSGLYWLAQHDVQRGGQPAYYYTMLLMVYEPLALFWSTLGVVLVAAMAFFAWRRRSRQAANLVQSLTPDWRLALPAMLVWWAITTEFVYSWAGEKMPWLTMHVALPLVLLGAWAFAKTLGWAFTAVRPSEADGDSATFERVSRASGRNRSLLVYLCVIGTLALFTFMLLAIALGSNGANLALSAAFIPLAFVLLLLAATFCYSLLRGLRESVGALALAVALIGGAYTLRSAYQLNYISGDTPQEMMIFVQTTPDVAQVMNRLEQASYRRTGGLAMPIWYDNETIWGWYTRRFTSKVQQQPALTESPGPDVQAVLMLQENIDTYPQNRDRLNGFVIQRLPLRWWFPEDQYRLSKDWLSAPVTENSPLLMRVLRTPFDSKTSSQFWQYILYRKPPGTLGSTDFILAVRPELANEIGLGTGAKR